MLRVALCSVTRNGASRSEAPLCLGRVTFPVSRVACPRRAPRRRATRRITVCVTRCQFFFDLASRLTRMVGPFISRLLKWLEKQEAQKKQEKKAATATKAPHQKPQPLAPGTATPSPMKGAPHGQQQAGLKLKAQSAPLGIKPSSRRSSGAAAAFTQKQPIVESECRLHFHVPLV